MVGAVVQASAARSGGVQVASLFAPQRRKRAICDRTWFSPTSVPLARIWGWLAHGVTGVPVPLCHHMSSSQAPKKALHPALAAAGMTSYGRDGLSVAAAMTPGQAAEALLYGPPSSCAPEFACMATVPASAWDPRFETASATPVSLVCPGSYLAVAPSSGALVQFPVGSAATSSGPQYEEPQGR